VGSVRQAPLNGTLVTEVVFTSNSLSFCSAGGYCPLPVTWLGISGTAQAPAPPEMEGCAPPHPINLLKSAKVKAGNSS